MAIKRGNLEPAERNPAELRRTAIILLLMAVVGGFMVTWAYRIKTSEDPDRPPIVSRLNRNLAALNQDKEGVDLGKLEGELWVATAVVLSDREAFSDTLAVLREVEGKYGPDQVGKIVCLTLDPENDRPDKLKAFADELGVSSDRWWFLAAGEEPMRGYAKDHLRLGTVTEETRDGKVVLEAPSVVAIVDQHRHLRGRYDFRQAREVAESAKKLLAEEPERADEFEEDFGQRPEEFADDDEELKEHFFKALDYILTEHLEEDEQS